MTPSRLGGFEVLDTLGRGGMGVVYRARDPRDGREVALKVLLAARGADPTRRRRFEREVEALSRLTHPSAVRVLGAGEDQGTPYLALELLEGGSLEERLARQGPLSPGQAASVVLALAGALDEAHRLGLVHRDLKPANVLFDAAGAPRLTDFGLVKDLDPGRSKLSQTGQASGTPGFWAPEQAAGEHAQIGPASDVYGLGALLYAALTGRPPFEGANLYELAVATTSRAADPPSRHRPGVPPALDAICLRCLAKEPGARYPSCAALAADLEAFLSGAATPPARRAGARLMLLAVAGATGVVALAAGLIASRRDRDTSAPRPDDTPVGVVAPPVPPAPTVPVETASPALPDMTAPPAPVDPPTPSARAVDEALERARAYLEHNEHDAARRLFDEALALDPRRVDALTGRGRARAALGDRQGAIADYTAALALDPRQPSTLVDRALMHGQLGAVDEAIADYTAALELAPGHAIAAAYRGNAHVRRGDVRAALADWTTALELDPGLTFVAFNRGTLRLDLGDLEGAIADLTTALDQGHPRRAHVLGSRGAARLRLGDHAAALDDLSASLALDPRQVAVLVARGDARRALGDRPGAAADYAAALQLDPAHARADELRAFVDGR